MWTLITFSWLPLLVGFAIGAATGWWIWARYTLGEREINLGYTPYQAEPEMLVAAAPVAVAPKKAKAKPAPKVIAETGSLPSVAAKRSPSTKAAAKPKAVAPRVAKVESEGPKLTALGIPSAQGPADDLLKLKGVGPKLNALLNRLGVTRFDQIAAWKAKEIALVDANLGAFKGRIVREQWVEQAKLLSQGKVRTFEQRFGTLDSENV